MPDHPEATVLAQLLVAADPGDAFKLIDVVNARDTCLASIASRLFEPAARSLGDAFSAGNCGDFEIVLGLYRLQTAVRRMSAGALSRAPADVPQRTVLVAPLPAESHFLGAVLDHEILWRAGWDTHLEHPASDMALQALVARKHFDVLDLSLSSAVLRDHWLQRLARTITIARRASSNAHLTVVVSGRIFNERPGTSFIVGADTCCPTVAQLESSLDRALGKDIRANRRPTALQPQPRMTRTDTSDPATAPYEYVATRLDRHSQTTV